MTYQSGTYVKKAGQDFAAADAKVKEYWRTVDRSPGTGTKTVQVGDRTVVLGEDWKDWEEYFPPQAMTLPEEANQYDQLKNADKMGWGEEQFVKFMNGVGGIANTLGGGKMGEAIDAAMDVPVLGAAMKGIGSVLKHVMLALDLGAEIPERAMGMVQQWKEAVRTGTTEEYKSHLGSAWRASSYFYNTNDMIPFWLDDPDGSGLRFTEKQGMPGGAELVKIRNLIEGGAKEDEVHQLLMEDLGALYYRGAMYDFTLHVALDFSLLASKLGLVDRAARFARTAATEGITAADLAKVSLQVESVSTEVREAKSLLVQATNALDETNLRVLGTTLDDASPAARVGLELNDEVQAAIDAKKAAEAVYEARAADLVAIQRTQEVLQGKKVLSPFEEKVVDLIGGLPKSFEAVNAAADGKRASFWKPWTWFRQRPESMAQHLVQDISDNLRRMLVGLGPEEVATYLDNPRLLLNNPKFAVTLYTPAGRATRTFLEGVDINLKQLYMSWAESANQRDLLQSISMILGRDNTEVLADIAKLGPEAYLKHISNIVDRVPQAKLLGAPVPIKEGLLSGMINAESIKSLDMMFNRGGVPWNVETFRLLSIGKVTEAAAQHAILQFGVQAEGFWTKVSNATKAAETLAFLRMNPGYPLRNFLNNEVTMWARGVWNTMSEKQIMEFWEKVGFQPERLNAGFGPAEIAAARAKKTIEAAQGVIGGAVRGEGNWLDKLTSFINNRKPLGRLDTGHFAAAIESMASRRAYTGAYMDFYSNTWKFAKTGEQGLQTMQDFLRSRYPLLDPEMFSDEFISALHGNIASSTGLYDIEGAFTGGVRMIDVRGAVTEVAHSMGRNADELMDVLGPENIGTLQMKLNTAMQVEDAGKRADAVQGVFRAMRDDIQLHLDDLAKQDLEVIADAAAARIKATDQPTAYLRLSQEQANEFHAAMEEYLAELPERVARIREIPSEQRAPYWKEFFKENDARFNRLFDRMEARYSGILRAGMRNGVVPNDQALGAFGMMRKSFSKFYTTKQRAYTQFFGTEMGTLDWQRLGTVMDREYRGLMEELRTANRTLDQHLYSVIDATRPHVSRFARAWRETVHDLRFNMMDEIAKQYERLYVPKLEEADKLAIYDEIQKIRTQFNNDIALVEREGLESLVTGVPFGAGRPEISEAIMSVYYKNAGIGSEQLAQAGPAGEAYDDLVQTFIDAGMSPEKAAARVRAQVHMGTQTLGGRLDQAINDLQNSGVRWAQDAERLQPANLKLRQLEQEGIKMTEAVPQALEELSTVKDRQQWLQLVMGETNDPAVANTTRSLLGKEWKGIQTQEQLADHLQNGRYIILSAEKEGMSAEERAAKMQELISEAESRGYTVLRTAGNYGGAEEASIIVPGMGSRDGYELGKMFKQESVLWHRGDGVGGLLYINKGHAGMPGTVSPINFKALNVSDDIAENYTVLKLADDAEIRFQMKVDFDNYYPWRAEFEGPNGTIKLERYHQDADVAFFDPHSALSRTGKEGAERLARLNMGDDFPDYIPYYLADTPPEAGIRKLPHKYTVVMKQADVYDMSLDPRGFMTRAIAEHGAGNKYLFHYAAGIAHEEGFLAVRGANNQVWAFVPMQTVENAQGAVQLGQHVGRQGFGGSWGNISEGALTKTSYSPPSFWDGVSDEAMHIRLNLMENFGISSVEAEFTATLADSFAANWARWNNSTKPMFYRRAIAGIDRGEAWFAVKNRSLEAINDVPPGAFFGDTKAGVSFLEDGRAVISALESPDVSSVVHELGHIFRRHLPAEELVKLEDWLGIKSVFENGVELRYWTTDHEETFARAFELYLREGVAPSPDLKMTFNKFQDWMTDIYRQVKDGPLDVNLTPEVRKVFDEMLSQKHFDDAPGVPPPGISQTKWDRQAPDQIPVSRGLDEIWYRDGRHITDRLEAYVVDRARDPGLDMNLSSEQRMVLNDYRNHVEGEMLTTQSAANSYASMKRDSALLNYSSRTYFDHAIGHMFPFAFWTTHSVYNWALWSLDNPKFLADFYRMKQAIERYGAQDMPQRFKGSVPLGKLPFLPDWMGPIYVNPLKIGFPFNFWTDPIEQTVYAGQGILDRTERTIQDMFENGQIDQVQYDEAMQHQGAVWEQALTEQQGSYKAENDPFETFSMLLSPHAPMLWAWHAARGHPERIGPFLPATRTIKGLTSLLGWPGGGLNIESGVRNLMGLQPFDEWDDYRVERMLSNMVGTGEISWVEANRAMIEGQVNPLWVKAQERAADEFGVAALGSTLGIPLRPYPPGEEAQRGLVDQMYQAYETGDKEVINKFFEENPEIKSRLALYDTPEERMKQFMSDQIWDTWHGLESLEKNKAVEALGPEFERLFLDKETRNLAEVDVDTLAVWTRMMHGDPPGTLTLNKDVAPIDFGDPYIAEMVGSYYDYRRQNYPPSLFDDQTAYFRISSRAERKKFLGEHSYLKDYWEWRRDWLKRNPRVAQYIVDDEESLKDILQYPTAAEAQAAQQGEPNLTPKEWAYLMGPELFNLVTDNLVLGEPLQGPEKEALTRLAERMGMSVSELMSAIRKSHQGG